MTVKRLLLLQGVMLLGFSGIFLLPKVTNIAPQGIDLHLPEFVGEWYGEDQQIGALELEILANDTGFARKLYRNGRGDEIFVSIVLSGHDLDNSIHRPERCLPAQGWSVADSERVTISVPELPKGRLPVTRLYNLRKQPLPNGNFITIHNLNFYWFVGYDNLTASHLERTLIDIRDRVMRGYNQRWAYITVASTITDNLDRFGRDETETDAMLRKFIEDLYPKIAKTPAK